MPTSIGGVVETRPVHRPLKLYAPSSLFMVGAFLLIQMASRIQRLYLLSSRTMHLAASQSITWLACNAWSVMADLLTSCSDALR